MLDTLPHPPQAFAHEAVFDLALVLHLGFFDALVQVSPGDVEGLVL